MIEHEKRAKEIEGEKFRNVNSIREQHING